VEIRQKGYVSMLKLKPAYKDYIWGGQKLRTDFNKISDLTVLAESWELSCHKDGESVIIGGEYDGLTFSEYTDRAGKSVLGTACEKFREFPVLIKLIDAADNLSVQVHPNDEYARNNEGEHGKTEMWYIVDCEEGATIAYGFNREISRKEFEKAIRTNTLTDVMNIVPVKKGDVFFIEGGILHSIGKGIVIAEIQQNSNTTYRVYDYGRLGADGNPRPLHIEKALEVTKLTPPEEYPVYAEEVYGGYTARLLSSCGYFTVEELVATEGVSIDGSDSTFRHLLIIDGDGNADGEPFAKGDSLFFAAGEDINLEGRFTAIETYISE